MSAKVIPLRLVKPEEDLAADDALSAALGKLQDVAVIGWALNGDLYFDTNCDGPSMLWLLELVKQALMSPDD